MWDLFTDEVVSGWLLMKEVMAVRKGEERSEGTWLSDIVAALLSCAARWLASTGRLQRHYLSTHSGENRSFLL
jgi:hypothetical protein